MITPADVEFVEQRLGFALPTIVKRLSLEVADGGYGPSWGIYRLKQPAGQAYGYPYDGKMSVESWHWLDHNADDYESPERMEQSLARFPPKFIRYCEVGCNIEICVDCTSDSGAMFVADPNTADHFEAIVPLHQTAEEWLWQWLNEEPWPELEYASFQISPDTHRGPVFGRHAPDR